MKTLLLNNQVFHFVETDLPILIHGRDKTGASLFTVSAIANLYTQGQKILFLSGYHMARDEFLDQTKANNKALLIENRDLLQKMPLPQTIFIKRETPELFIEAIQTLPDINERVVLIKNFDLFDSALFEAAKNTKLILSGDIDRCAFKDKIAGISWKTKILFSQPEVNANITLPALEKYEGYLRGVNKEGVVSLKM